MTTANIEKSLVQKPLRVWPGVLAVGLQWLIWLALPALIPGSMLYAIGAGVLGGGLAVLLWWVFFSRMPWIERVGVPIFAVVFLLLTARVVDASIANAGMQIMIWLFAIPALSLALVCGAVLSRHMASGPRRATIAATILLGCGSLTLLRTGGFSGDGDADLHWRWTPTPEQRLLSLTDKEETIASAAPSDASVAALWPGFRGANRDGIVRGVQIAIDWSQSPPVELWRRPVGPGWSSFAVGGDVCYTQEQRGDDEIVSCYSLTTGKLVWRHLNAARFWEATGGAGPRATPALGNGRVYTLGATGIASALNAVDGTVIWSRDAAADTGAKLPGWGFAGSPLVVDDLVVFATAGRLVAYDLASGAVRWSAKSGGGGYSSPHLMTIDGVKQIVLHNGSGALSVAPATGTQLWKYAWPSDGIVQPALTKDGDMLLGSGSGLGAGGTGVHRLKLTQSSEDWSAEERLTSIGLKPYYNDFVVHKGHAYGFDGSLLACIDLTNGQRKWKGGRYGHGQVILLADQDLLLVLSEKGEIVLVSASPESFRELARRRAIEGKTWNHPVLAGDILLVRNDQEMAAFRLALAGEHR